MQSNKFQIIWNFIIISLLQGGLFKGIPFVFGVIPVLIALIVACCIKDNNTPFMKKSSGEYCYSNNVVIILAMGALVIINFSIYRAQRLGVHSFDEINVFFLRFFRLQFTQCIMTASSVGEHININLIIIYEASGWPSCCQMGPEL